VRARERRRKRKLVRENGRKMWNEEELVSARERLRERD